MISRHITNVDISAGMNIRWDYFVNQYDTSRYVASADGRNDRHIQFVREFASVVSILQVSDILLLWSNVLINANATG